MITTSKTVILTLDEMNYDVIANTYEFVNTLCSFGMIGKWRNEITNCLTNRGPMRILDLACGSGELIKSFFSKNLDIISVNGIDQSDQMITKAKKRFKESNLNRCVFVEKGDACNLRFKNDFFDAVTLTFSLRDFKTLSSVLKEAHRVLKVDCPLIILDIANPEFTKFKFLYSAYMQYVFSRLGGLISGAPDVYKRISEKLTILPDTEYLSKELKISGFHKVSNFHLFTGIAFMIVGKKRIE